MLGDLALKIADRDQFDPRSHFDPNDSQGVTPGFDPHGNSYSNLAELKLCLQVGIDQIERGEYTLVTDSKKFFDDIWQEVLERRGLATTDV